MNITLFATMHGMEIATQRLIFLRAVGLNLCYLGRETWW